jgi:hypothetical protein
MMTTTNVHGRPDDTFRVKYERWTGSDENDPGRVTVEIRFGAHEVTYFVPSESADEALEDLLTEVLKADIRSVPTVAPTVTP